MRSARCHRTWSRSLWRPSQATDPALWNQESSSVPDSDICSVRPLCPICLRNPQPDSLHPCSLAERFLDIQQISIALGGVLSKDNSILQIINSFEAINFESVRNHVALVSLLGVTGHRLWRDDRSGADRLLFPFRCATADLSSSCRRSRSISVRSSRRSPTSRDSTTSTVR